MVSIWSDPAPCGSSELTLTDCFDVISALDAIDEHTPLVAVDHVLRWVFSTADFLLYTAGGSEDARRAFADALVHGMEHGSVFAAIRIAYELTGMMAINVFEYLPESCARLAAVASRWLKDPRAFVADELVDDAAHDGVTRDELAMALRRVADDLAQWLLLAEATDAETRATLVSVVNESRLAERAQR